MVFTVAERFKILLDAYRQPDGSKWSGQGLEDATNGIVTRSYVSALKRGHVSQPAYDKLYAISRAMDFPVELWSEEVFEEFALGSEIAKDEPMSDQVVGSKYLDSISKQIIDKALELPKTQQRAVLDIIESLQSLNTRT